MYEFDLEIYADKIFYFRGIYKNSNQAVRLHKEMDELLDSDSGEVFNKLVPWKTSGDNGLIYGTIRNSNRNNLSKTKNEEVQKFYTELEDLFHFAGKFYFEKLGMDYADGAYLRDLATFHYYTGKSMGPHVDDYGSSAVESIATGLIYLNDDKIGGDLWFPEQKVLIKSESGSMVIFPSVEPFFHASTEITEGEKYHIGNAWKRNKSKEEM
jgi:hypothetical protein